MGIGRAIFRVKEGVRRAGLEGVVTRLGAQLRSAAIPPALRPAAQKLADLLTGFDRPEQPPVVSLNDSLNDSIAAHEANRMSHAELAAAGGACPFAGVNAGLAGLLDASQFEAPAFELVHTADAIEPLEAQIVASVASEPTPVEVVPEATAPKSPGASAVAKRSSKRVALAKPDALEKKSPSRSEKEPEKVAARPATSKAPARSTASKAKLARPAARRPVAKAVTKKDETGL